MAGMTAANDSSGDVVGIVAGSGILLFQAAAVIPGLLPILLLTLAFVVPLLAIGLALAPLVAIPYAIWRAGGWALAIVTSRRAAASTD
jgi:hypothetical protein